MHTKTKNRLINTFSFIVHLAISVSLVLMTNFVISWEGHYDRTGKTFGFYYLIMFIGIILFFVNFLTLSGASFKKFIVPFSISLFAMLLWILVEGSMDVSAFLLVYLIVFLPLVYYKYKLNYKN